MNKLVIVFDLDGTLLKGEKLICDVANLALKKCGFNASIQAKDIGPPLSQMLVKATNTSLEELSDCILIFKKLYDEQASESPLHEGASLLLRQLKPYADIWLATNKRRVPTEKIIQANGWEPLIGEYVFCGDDEGGISKSEMLKRIKSKTLSAKIDSWIMVGDTQTDYDAALLAGFDHFIWAQWGAKTPLVKSGQLRVNSPFNLVEILKVIGH